MIDGGAPSALTGPVMKDRYHVMAPRRPTITLKNRPVVARHGANANHTYRVIRERGSGDWLLIHGIGGCGRVIGPKGEVEIPAGTAVLFPAGCPHDYGTAPGHERWSFHWAHFLPRDGWERLLAWPSPIGGAGVLSVASQTRELVEQALVTTSLSAAGTWPGDMEAARSALELALRLYDRVNPGRGGRIDPRIRDAMDAIAAEPSLALDLARLARTAGISTSRFAHLFRAHANMSPGRWAELMRLRQAASELLGSFASIAQVAASAGFADPYYFSARFRRHFGVSPRAYRDQRAC